jgi:DNA-binding CsgD family transcriptional regulator
VCVCCRDKLVRKTLSRPKSNKPERLENETIIPRIQTRYGKKLNLTTSEKLELVAKLTPREKETFFILLGGYSLKETAKQLGISYSTANTHQTAIYKKLHVNSRAELIISYRDLCEEHEPTQ